MTTRVDRLTVVFQASSFCLACFAAVMFGLAEGAALPQFLTIPAAIVAYRVTERTRRFVLPLSWANALGVMALLAAIAEFIGEDVEERLLAGGHQLVYLTWITMFMDKKPRQYWWLCVLGVLQVAVGSVLTLDPWYGMFLLVYLAGIIWTLTVFSIYQAQAGINESAAPPDSPEVSPLVSARRLAPAGAIPFVNGSSVALGSIQIDDGANWIDRRLLLSAAVTLLGSFLMGCLVFMGVPRVWIGASPFGDQHWLPGRNVSGFSETVRLAQCWKAANACSAYACSTTTPTSRSTSKALPGNMATTNHCFGAPSCRNTRTDDGPGHNRIRASSLGYRR